MPIDRLYLNNKQRQHKIRDYLKSAKKWMFKNERPWRESNGKLLAEYIKSSKLGYQELLNGTKYGKYSNVKDSSSSILRILWKSYISNRCSKFDASNDTAIEPSYERAVDRANVTSLSRIKWKRHRLFNSLSTEQEQLVYERRKFGYKFNA